MTKTIPVSIRAMLLEGKEGWLVKWCDANGKVRRYFVLTYQSAKQVKARAKQGLLPKGWAVKA